MDSPTTRRRRRHDDRAQVCGISAWRERSQQCGVRLQPSPPGWCAGPRCACGHIVARHLTRSFECALRWGTLVRVKGMSTSFIKCSAVALGGAVLLFSGTMSFSQAQTATPSATHARQQSVMELAAAKLGLTGDQLSSALKEARKDLGVNQGVPKAGKLVHHELSVAATALGIGDVKTLRSELAGSTLAAVAQKHNVQLSTLAGALKADVDAKIQAMVAAGTLRRDHAGTLKLKAEAKVDAFMTHQFKAAKAGA